MEKKIIAMIPARMGSTRFKKKNLALIDGKPMIYYVLEAAKKAECFDRIIINSEDEAFGEIAKRYGVEFYLRPEELGSSFAKSDDVVADFMKNNPASVTAWVNSVSPLQSSIEIKNVIDYFLQNNLNSLITTIEEKVHCLYDKKPLNYSHDEIFAQTQDLRPIERFVYSIMMWTNETFLAEYNKNGVAMMCGKFGTYSVDKLSGIIVKTQRDFEICKLILESSSKSNFSLSYDKEANE
jgi:CMP-N-acetylneuraminic acid synthetase